MVVKGARDNRQRRIADWCEAAFGKEEATSLPQRGLRLLEEAAEAAQAAGLSSELARRCIDHVFARPPGVLGQELGGVGVTVLAMAAAAGISADEAETVEVSRVTSITLDHFRQRNAKKNEAGLVATKAAP